MKKYKQLFKQLERDILGEKYQLGDFLPSEHQLMDRQTGTTRLPCF